MAQKSKFFRVAVEGATTDGRNIERAWIEQMGRNYDPEKYGARIWMEHIRGTTDDNKFKAYGDVIATKSDEVVIDGKKKLALFAQIAPLPDLVKMTTKDKQKIYSSIEVNPKFADSGEAYLVGLGVTDSPASLGTEILAFASKQKPEANPFTNRKQDKDNLFCESVELKLEFEDDEEDPEPTSKFSTAVAALTSRLGKFSLRSKKSDSDSAALAEFVGELAEDIGEMVDAFSDIQGELQKQAKQLATFQKSHKELEAKFAQIDTTDASRFTQRPAATGTSGNKVLTDC